MIKRYWLFSVALCLTAAGSLRGFDRCPEVLPEQETEGSGAKTDQAQAASDDRILQKWKEAVKESTERVLQAVRENRDPNQSDVRLNSAILKASAALDIRIMLESPHFTHSKMIRRARLDEGIEASKRVIRAFNEDGGDADFSSDDLEFLQAFQMAFTAAEVLQKANSPTLAGKLKQEQIQEGVEASKRIVAEFNEKGGDAYFSSEDREILRTLAKALSKPQ